MDHAPLVVLIHGSLDRAAGMARLARELSGRARVLRYDRRGYGRSWPHSGPFGVTQQVEDLVRVIGERRAILIGHSYGGNVALGAAAVLGSQVMGVSTYETPLSWLDWWPTDTAGSLGVSAGPEMAAERFLTRLVGDDVWQRLPEKTRQVRRREGVALVGELGALRRGQPWDHEQIMCPVLCGHGSDARAHHVRGTRWIVDCVGTARHVVIDGAGHGAPHSHPAEFARMLVDPHLSAMDSNPAAGL